MIISGYDDILNNMQSELLSLSQEVINTAQSKVSEIFGSVVSFADSIPFRKILGLKFGQAPEIVPPEIVPKPPTNVLSSASEMREWLQYPRNGEVYRPDKNALENVTNLIKTPEILDSFNIQKNDQQWIKEAYPFPKQISPKDIIFTCSVSKQRKLHDAFRDFFSSNRISIMRSEAYQLARKIIRNASPNTQHVFGRSVFQRYASEGVLRLLKSSDNLAFIEHFQARGFSYETAYITFMGALAANQQIAAIIEIAWDSITMKSLQNVIIKEIREACANGTKATDAMFESRTLNSIIFESMRINQSNAPDNFEVGRPAAVLERYHVSGDKISFLTRELSMDPEAVGESPESTNLHRFDDFKSSHWPKLPFMPFGSGPNGCAGWQLPKVQITAMLFFLCERYPNYNNCSIM
jgi:hypothetical protein